MVGDRNRQVTRLSSPDAVRSEDNMSLSVQVNMGGASRSRGTPARSRASSREPSPSIVPGPPSRVQTANNSQSSAAATQDQPSTEEILIGLITPTDTNVNANTLADALKDLKRRRDGDSDDEPCPKRDRLGDELEEMHAAALLDTNCTNADTPAASGVEGVSASPKPHSSDRAACSATSTAIPLRPRQGNEATAPAAAAASNQEYRISESEILGDEDSKGAKPANLGS
ncbi:hypothetical protein QBC34DRAFT_119025 [Podospora aff. communis PSN243]|uniref:Uncharacterized protein n=1 Tax=Podospora aff. communis PSN243 TaxID=3040156 RepID=A0AAV9GHY0_9PEZI|nr:hypothetical protein QBC34DRAFT_119025 [Podospora aff. communis PSN243]